MIKYIIISPVRNEEEFIETTIIAILKQTQIPSEWIIVNDGSTDQTCETIKKFISAHPWIKLIHLEDRGYYLPGKGVVDAFYKGYEAITDNNWEYIVKLDCDLDFSSDYFERIFAEFNKNPKLGIASGATYISKNGAWVIENIQDDHPVGPSKVYRRKCWESFGGIKSHPGWDLADLLAAQMRGWETQCFKQYKIKHFRVTGSRRKSWTGGKFLLGRFHLRYGYGPFYTFLKSVYWLKEKPFVLGGVSIFAGYIYAAIRMEPRLFEKDMRRFLRKKQRVYLKQKITGLFA
jgi:glycosyltransferase involved in cell wall biosynthesis